MSSIQEINERCRAGKALVMTEHELWRRLRSGEPQPHPDVVVFAFSASMRGAAAMILVPVTGPGVFTRAETITLGGVPAYPGPAPNERLGVVDAQLFADEALKDDAPGVAPAGARVLLDVLANREVPVECLSIEGDTYHSTFRREQIDFARLVTYNTFLPARLNRPSAGRPPAHLDTIRVGGTIFLNRAQGIVIGDGTRNMPGRASLSLSADMLRMDAGCVRLAAGEALQSVAIPVPVTDDAVLADICRCLAEIPEGQADVILPASDRETAEYVRGRIAAGECVLTSSPQHLGGFA